MTWLQEQTLRALAEVGFRQALARVRANPERYRVFDHRPKMIRGHWRDSHTPLRMPR